MGDSTQFCSDDDNNIALYSSLLQKYGDSYLSLNWGSKVSQHLRFKVLSEIGLNPGDSILDVGCGLGDLYEWLKLNDIDIEYSGVDITPAMIDFARKRFPNVNFIEGNGCNAFEDLNKRFDFILASGIFAHRQKNPVGFLKDSIKDMFKISNKGIAFNCLSAWREEKDVDEFYADPVEILNYCRSISNRIIFRHDYHSGDFTIYLYKMDSIKDV